MALEESIATSEEIVVKCENLKKYYLSKKGFFGLKKVPIKVINGITFQIRKGETFAIVGESGCGKTVLSRILLGLEQNVEGKLTITPGKKKRQIIFQDTAGALHPRWTVLQSLEEPLILSGISSKKERIDSIREIMHFVGMDEMYLERYPRALSGGQRQRIVIARALTTSPELLIADEPISSLDVSLQAQVINLLLDLQERQRVSILLIAHDLAVVRQIANDIAIMYLGTFVETGKAADIYRNALHPYTKVLLDAAPSVKKGLNDEKFQVNLKEGDTPTPENPPEGCPFCVRCMQAEGECYEYPPEAKEVESGHFVACHKIAAH
ncbi:MAG: ATP-binding cassette domain-containing protein [Clostridiales bacterium]|nr:ATP-binding cassette domain-containing protein [Clostridiales bacterium]